MSSQESTANKSLETDSKGRLLLSLSLLPKMVQSQLCATGDITGVAGIPIYVLRLEQLTEWHKGELAYSLAAAQFQRYTFKYQCIEMALY